MPRRYTHNQKARAVAEAEVNGTTQAAERLGIPRKTLEYWVDSPAFAELRQKTREEKRDGYRILVALSQKRLAELIPTMEPRDLTMLMGVSQDKDLLLSGDATTRTETRTSLSHWSDDDLAAGIVEADRILDAARQTGDAAGAPAEVGTD